MKCRLLYIFLVLSVLIPSEIYKQVKVLHVSSDDINLFQTSGIEFDHADYNHGEFIEFAGYPNSQDSHPSHGGAYVGRDDHPLPRARSGGHSAVYAHARLS